MALYPSVAAAMTAQGFTGSSLGSGTTLWTKRTVQNGQTGTLQARTIQGTSPTPQAAIESVAPSNVERMQEASAEGQRLAINEARTLNTEIARQFETQLSRANPEARALQAQMTAQTQSLLRGEIPQDVANLIRQYSAEQQMQGALAGTARNLGLTSLELSARGFEQGQQLFEAGQRYFTAPTVDIAGTSGRIREQLYGTQAMSPAQAGALMGQASAQQQQASMFNAEMQYARDLTQLAVDRQRWLDEIEIEKYERSVAAQQAEEAAKLRSFSGQSSLLATAQASNEAYLKRLRAGSGGGEIRYREPGTSTPYEQLSSVRNFGVAEGIPTGYGSIRRF